MEAQDINTLLQQLPAPKGISVEAAARMLGYSVSYTRELCEVGDIPAWRFDRVGADGATVPARKWRVDEVGLRIIIALKVAKARAENLNLRQALKQGHFNFS